MNTWIEPRETFGLVHGYFLALDVSNDQGHGIHLSRKVRRLQNGAELSLERGRGEPPIILETTPKNVLRFKTSYAIHRDQSFFSQKREPAYTVRHELPLLG